MPSSSGSPRRRTIPRSPSHSPILNEKAQPAGGDIFGTPASAAKKDEEKIFAEMATQPAWHEPLLFLVEKLRQSAPDTRTILGWTFPQLATEPKIRKGADPGIAVEKWMPFTAAQLLAGISMDQEVTLDDAQREKIWRSLWQGQIATFRSKVIYSGWNIAPSLLISGSAYHTAVLEAAVALKPTKLHLLNCTAVSDLKPLAGLASLNELSLVGCMAVSDLKPLAGLASWNELSLVDCTGVSDLTPLAGLASLNELSLVDCTGVSDLTPLARLASLNSLNLDGCTAVSDLTPLARLASLNSLNLVGCTAVSDLTPLARLASLNSLNLDGCTAVSDLTPLAGLASLNSLTLFGCTAVSDEAVAALKASLPQLKIHRQSMGRLPLP